MKLTNIVTWVSASRYTVMDLQKTLRTVVLPLQVILWSLVRQFY